MAIFKRPGTANYAIGFEYRGQRYQKSSGTSDPSEARTIEAAWRIELRNETHFGKPSALPPMSFADAIERYTAEVVAAKQSHVLPATIASSVARLNQLAQHLGEETQLVAITQDAVAAYRGRLLRDGLKPGSVNRQLTILRAILNRAHTEWGVLASVPKVARLDVHDERDRVLEADEEVRLLAIAPDHLRDFVTFLIDTGARRVEALLLRWLDFDLGAKPSVSILTRKAKKVVRRRVPLTPRVVAIMRCRLAANPVRVWPWMVTGMSERSRKGKGGRRVSRSTMAKPFGVYVNARGGFDARLKVEGKLIHIGHFAVRSKAIEARMDAEILHYGDGSDASLDHQFERAVAQAGLSDLFLHDCRHTYASRLARNGVSLGLIGELVGHSDPRMTKRYAHWRPGDMDDAVLGALVRP